MQVQITDNKVLCKFPYNPILINQVNKEGLGMRWNKARKFWHHDLTIPFAKAFINEFPDEAPEELHEIVKIPDVQNWESSPYLMQHQKEGAEFALTHPRHGFFWDTGTGKTIHGLEIYKQKGVKTLVVCPLSIIENAWIEDAEKFCPEINIINLWDLKRKSTSRSGKMRYQKALESCDIAVINFDRFRIMRKELQDVGFKMLIIDESSKMKNSKAKTTKELIKFADTILFVYLFSGTPAPNSELEYYSQVRILDQSILSSSFYAFRNRYFIQKGFGGFTWEMNPEMRQDFLNKLATVSSVIRKHDVLDLPEKTINIRQVFLSKAEMSAYREMEKHMLLEIGDSEVLAANAAVKVMKLREGTSGFFIDEDGEVISTGISKLEELTELLEEIGKHQVVIWTNFHHEAESICTILQGQAETFARADGTINQDKKNQAIKDFKAGNVQYLIGHPASIGHGITLTNCSYMIYFSLSYSYELQSQSQDRIYRKGQHNACSYYYLVVPGTIDMAIVRALKSKKKITEEVFNYIKGRGL